MKNIFSILLFIIPFALYGSVDSLEFISLQETVVNLESFIERLQQADVRLREQQNKQSIRLDELSNDLASANQQIVQQKAALDAVAENLEEQLMTTNDSIAQKSETLSASIQSRTLWAVIGIMSALCFVAVVFFVLRKKISHGTSTLTAIKLAQDSLATAQKSMQEESVKLDNKLVELLEKQMTSQPIVTESKSSEPDHSLALKVADEIIRIETNLSKMDPSVKGYKQLSKAVERIRANFMANGYEIVDMLNKPYNEGMKVTANFVSDESLADGEQKITGITKPQINYNGKMIQSAQITVSQNI